MCSSDLKIWCKMTGPVKGRVRPRRRVFVFTNSKPAGQEEEYGSGSSSSTSTETLCVAASKTSRAPLRMNNLGSATNKAAKLPPAGDDYEKSPPLEQHSPDEESEDLYNNSDHDPYTSDGKLLSVDTIFILVLAF